MKLKDIMSKDVKYVESKDNIINAAKIMKDLNVGCVPVCEKERPIGILTDRDIIVRNIAEGRNINNVNVEDTMSNRVVYGTPDMDVHEAAVLMSKYQIRRLPVVEKGKIVGMVSIGDLAVQNNLVDDAGQALYNISQQIPANYLN
ncbi:CBS domain-containing protein [Garciella nitratireducens]|uniref:CBS domain-containing protein n=1 Tax=Garciella nitratireducens DSM 15102 TaxID=1121911 RepID=A0A1T4K2U2_9FIRM|nr:CBS domain-containing protein [Garciella nitratireducens]RBP46637.1 CBS domain protein [Garciella nitratireducens]SJZ36760.1 CBS domain-containing protein [Garciella nitratireducens DSM 15102]